MQGAALTRVVDTLLKGEVGDQPVAVMLETGEPAPPDWRERFRGVGRVHFLRGEGKKRIRNWLWSMRHDLTGEVVWIVKRGKKPQAGFGNLG